ncbi:ABC transporter ATP-binding protein [Nocardioides sp. L-11A]|uniref:ABC transporter ATP-binding protein n=1 Tax=Nocardioides sp. L-11A TaxID=3043848 RepID=UPI00249BA72E|nr:ABC transporter ATP-binding protein [Nocardioides sp. L-11A]
MSLVATDLAISFGGVSALAGVGLTLEPGTVHGVIGPNGSGKSTMFNCLTGLIRPDRGTVVLDERDISGVATHRRIHLGLARTFQTPRFDPATTVWQAVACGFYPTSGRGLLPSLLWAPWVSRAERATAERTDALLADFRLDDARDATIGELPLGRVRLVEVARAMAMAPRYLLLDEPAAGLAVDEQELLASELTRLAGAGVGVLLVEHNFDLVVRMCHRILVLERGRVLTEGTAAEVAVDPAVQRVYLGMEEVA